MASRNVTGPLYRPGGNVPWSHGTIKFKPTLFATSTAAYPGETYTVTTDENGNFDINLAVPDSGSINYTIIFPDASTLVYALGAGATITIADIVNIGTTTGSPNELEQLLSGAGINDKNYRHVQTVPADTWTITHNLNKYPSITIVDSAGDLVLGNVSFVSFNQLIVSFSAAFGGEAYLN